MALHNFTEDGPYNDKDDNDNKGKPKLDHVFIDIIKCVIYKVHGFGFLEAQYIKCADVIFRFVQTKALRRTPFVGNAWLDLGYN